MSIKHEGCDVRRAKKWQFFYFLWHVVASAAVGLDVNTTVGEPAILPCTLMIETPTSLENLRFYWQDDRQYVLYSYDKGN